MNRSDIDRLIAEAVQFAQSFEKQAPLAAKYVRVFAHRSHDQYAKVLSFGAGIEGGWAYMTRARDEIPEMHRCPANSHDIVVLVDKLSLVHDLTSSTSPGGCA